MDENGLFVAQKSDSRKREADRDAQDKREAGIRAEVEKASQTALAESEQQVKDLEVQLQADRDAQKKREAGIRAEVEKASQTALAESWQTG